MFDDARASQGMACTMRTLPLIRVRAGARLTRPWVSTAVCREAVCEVLQAAFVVISTCDTFRFRVYLYRVLGFKV